MTSFTYGILMCSEFRKSHWREALLYKIIENLRVYINRLHLFRNALQNSFQQSLRSCESYEQVAAQVSAAQARTRPQAAHMSGAGRQPSRRAPGSPQVALMTCFIKCGKDAFPHQVERVQRYLYVN